MVSRHFNCLLVVKQLWLKHSYISHMLTVQLAYNGSFSNTIYFLSLDVFWIFLFWCSVMFRYLAGFKKGLTLSSIVVTTVDCHSKAGFEHMYVLKWFSCTLTTSVDIKESSHMHLVPCVDENDHLKDFFCCCNLETQSLQRSPNLNSCCLPKGTCLKLKMYVLKDILNNCVHFLGLLRDE